jgi:hypothetical protein
MENATETICPPASSAPAEDKRLDRLLDYTKFHVGIYLSIGGGLVALIGASSKAEEKTFLKAFIGSPKALALALFFMVLAGLAGGIIASGCTQCRTFEELWRNRQGPYRLRLLTGESWALVEHGSFWISLLLFTYAVLSAPAVCKWLWGT